jgi:hypothetical protein
MDFKRPSGTSRGVMTEKKPGFSAWKDGKKWFWEQRDCNEKLR